ncbi:MAG: hypothetical protein KDA24_03335 [Deltaproteobacteria bacterium]|nr:hypothetical protein [Deltaproteobacteria bacterium]
MRPTPIVLVACLAVALPAWGAEPSAVDRLGAPATLHVKDRRPSDQRADELLGYLYDDRGDPVASGPGDGFSLQREVSSAFMDAGHELGIPLYRGPEGSEVHHVQADVLSFWCDDTAEWSFCSAEVLTTISGPLDSETSVTLEVDEPGSWSEMREALSEMVLLELARAQNDVGLGEGPDLDGVSHPGLRFGWIETADGTRLSGALGDTSSGLCVQGAQGAEQLVPLEEIVDVRVVDVPLIGAQRGDGWAVLSAEDGTWVGGRTLPGGRANEVVIRTLDGARRFSATDSGLVQGFWAGGAPTCDVPGTTSGRPSGTPTSSSRRPSGAINGVVVGDSSKVRRPTAERPMDSAIVYVDRRGKQLDLLGPELDTVYAVRMGRLGDRRWKRYRLSWSSFAAGMGNEYVNLRLEEWREHNYRLKNQWTAVMGASIGAAIVSGVATVALSAAWGNTGEEGFLVASPFAAHGIGAGAFMAGFASVARVRVGKRADRPNRYYNLLEYLTLDELDQAMLEGEAAEEPVE